MAFEGWNLIRFKSEIARLTAEIAKLTAEIAQAKINQAAGASYAGHMAKINALERAKAAAETMLASVRAAMVAYEASLVPAVVETGAQQVAKTTLRQRLVAALASRLGVTLATAGRIASGLSIAGLIALLLSLGVMIYNRFGGGSEVAEKPCPPLVMVRKLCPYARPGSSIDGECKPGFCWDGGYGHSLACKQENLNVPNTTVTDLNDLWCQPGFPKQVRDRCTGVLLRCER
jgi:hypothetical protein